MAKSRPPYADYSKHCLRFYFNNPIVQSFLTPVDEKYWKACELAFTDYNSRELTALDAIYSGHEALIDRVGFASKTLGLNPSYLWDLMKRAEKDVAIARGLK